MVIRLKKEFTGKGEVSPFKFRQIRCTTTAYLYKVYENGTKSHYEVFKRKTTPLCIDFENHIYSDTKFKELYPRSNAFGVWAWTCKSLVDALNKLNQIES